jgi:hypothetical protein
MAKIIKPPAILKKELFVARPSLALFGSIEQGAASNWQAKCEEKLKEYDIDIYNPRRDQWDTSWVQSIDNPQFKGQVEWELTVLENVSVRLFYFDPNTKSPITLAELGLAAAGLGTLDTIVCCPEDYWRKGNVDIICERYGIHQEKTLEDTLFDAVSRLSHYYGATKPENVKIYTEIVEEPIIEDVFEA